MAIQVFPFILGLGLLCFQPLLDRVWTNRLKAFDITGDPAKAALWASMVSAFIPSAVLTMFGALAIAVDSDTKLGDWILIATIVIYTLSFMLFLLEVVTGVPTRTVQTPLGLKIGEKVLIKPIATVPFGRLQLYLAFLNILGIALAITFHLTSKDDTEKPQPEKKPAASSQAY